MTHKNRLGKVLVGTIAVSLVLSGLLIFWFTRGAAPGVRAESPSGEEPQAEPLSVRVCSPLKGGIERTTTQPGTVRAFEHEDVYAKVSGFLKNQRVDRGSVVKKGELLAEIDAPEFFKEEQLAAAKVKQANAQVDQMIAAVAAAKAEVEAAKVLVEQKEAEVKRARAFLTFREKQYDRIKSLADDKSVDLRLLDEQFQHLEASQAQRDAALVGVKTALADVEAKKVRVTQAEADLLAARANVEVTDAALQKAQIFVEFTKIRSHYDGVVTARNYHNGDYIRSAERGDRGPLLVVQRTDLMRVIVQVPDTDAPYVVVGNPVDLAINTLPKVKFPSYKVSRVPRSQDQESRTMRVEVDVPNDNQVLIDGMYGDVTIHLQLRAKEGLRVPSTAVVRRDGGTAVFVVRDNVAHQVPVQVGRDNGARAEILSGLNADDLIAIHPRRQLHDGATVRPRLMDVGK